MAFLKQERLHALSQQHAGVARNHRREPRARWSSAKQVAVLVDDVDAGCIVSALGFRYRRLSSQRWIWDDVDQGFPVYRISRALLERSALLVNQTTTHRGII